jgi:hypothetical protein
VGNRQKGSKMRNKEFDHLPKGSKVEVRILTICHKEAK